MSLNNPDVTGVAMEENVNWLEKIENEVARHRFLFGMFDPADNPMNTLVRVARRINEYSSNCIYCEEYKKEIENITLNFDTLKNLPTSKRKRPFRKLKPVIRHLQREHKLVVHDQYAKTGMVVGLAAGAVLGLVVGIVLKNHHIGIILGMLIGLFTGMKIGSSLESSVRKDKRLL